MSISAPFIARPIATLLLAVGLLLAGLLGYRELPVSSLPEVDFPTIQVSTRLPGASADTMANLVTAPLERQLGQMPSLTSMNSTSAAGLSQITLQFALDRDIDAAAQDVQSAINAADSTLPSDLPYPPTYSKVNPADVPILTIALTSKELPISKLADLADTFLAQRLSQISGVGRVSVQGGIKPAIRVQLDLARLASLGIGIEAVRTAIADANTSGAKGSLNGAEKSFTIAANDQLEDAAAYKGLVIAYSNGAPVRLRDIATVIDGVENDKVAAWSGGEAAVVIDIQRQSGANIVQTVQALRDLLPHLQAAMPQGATLSIVNDRTETIRASVADVQFTLVLSTALVVMVVFVFLRQISATLIAAATLPLSLICTFGIMWFCDFSLDNLSLMALTIGTGFVIDDAIVMIENISRRLEAGMSPLKAAFSGAGEIGFTVISLTLSLIAVFIPLLFMTGVVGRLFREFALTLTIAVIVSAVISLTLTPMMCGRLMRERKDEARPGPIGRAVEGCLNAIQAGYARSLTVVLRHRTLTLLVALGTAFLTVWLYVAIPKGFLPRQDTSLVIATSEAAQDVSFQAMSQAQQQVERIVAADPDVVGTTSLVGVGTSVPAQNIGRLQIVLKPKDERQESVDTIIARLKARLDGLAAVRVFFQPVQDVQLGTTSGRTQYQYRLTSSEAKLLEEWAGRLSKAMAERPGLLDVSSDLQDFGPRVLINVDRVAAGRLGVSMSDVQDALDDAFGQRQISTIFGQANQYRVVLEAMSRYRRDPSALRDLYVSNSDGAQVPLSAVASIVPTTAPLVVMRQEQFPAATISFDIDSSMSLGEAITAIDQARQDIGMPESVSGEFVGDAAEFAKSTANEPLLILAAIVVIYIVLGVLYESLVHPITILTTLPSAGVGALLALMLFGLQLTLPGLIGIVLLMGIVKKNAIIMIDFAIEAERQDKLPPVEAIFKAATLRFRPITMTTLAALLGAVPLALASGPGSELRVPLGVTIIGGLLLSQLLTLYTTPVVYLAMDGLKDRLTAARRRPRAVGLARPAE